MTTSIKTARQAAGLTQRQLADLTGINVRQVQKIESGEIKLGNITAANYLRLCEALDLDPTTALNQ